MSETMRERVAVEVQQAMLIEGDAYTIAKEATDAILALVAEDRKALVEALDASKRVLSAFIVALRAAIRKAGEEPSRLTQTLIDESVLSIERADAALKAAGEVKK